MKPNMAFLLVFWIVDHKVMALIPAASKHERGCTSGKGVKDIFQCHSTLIWIGSACKRTLVANGLDAQKQVLNFGSGQLCLVIIHLIAEISLSLT